eukprot:COSAG02_NODE_50190_length_322_cov_0.690583_1_plen_53_part_01
MQSRSSTLVQHVRKGRLLWRLPVSLLLPRMLIEIEELQRAQRHAQGIFEAASV